MEKKRNQEKKINLDIRIMLPTRSFPAVLRRGQDRLSNSRL